MDDGDSLGPTDGWNGIEVNTLGIYGMKVDEVGEERAQLNGAQISKRERPFLRREVSLHRMIGVAGMNERNYLDMLPDALKRFPLVTIGLRRRAKTLAILECMFAITRRAEGAFLGVKALYLR